MRSIEIDEVNAQLDFIRSDLSTNPLLIAISPIEGMSERRFLLVGRTLNYRLHPFQLRPGMESTWSLAYCESAATQRPAHASIIGEQVLSNSALDVLPATEVRRRFASMQGKGLKWDQLIPATNLQVDASPAARRYRGLVLVQMLESLKTKSRRGPRATCKRP
jgi:hypothetical protein